MYTRKCYHLDDSDGNLIRCFIVLVTLITDGLDLVNVFQSMDEMRKKPAQDTGTAIHYLYCCNCFCLGSSACYMFCTMWFSFSLPDIDVSSCLVVWFGDVSQAVHDIRFSNGPLDPRTISNFPDAAAVFTVSLVRLALLIARCWTSPSTGPSEEWRKNCRKFQALGLCLNLLLTFIALGKISP